MDPTVNFGTLLHGGDYNPEQWLDRPEILEKDIELLKKAKINTVSVGIFAWSTLEPEEGAFQFDWLERIINRLYENGISVILATPSGARPKWMADRYPEVLRVDAERRRQLFGRRHNHCYTSPVYREKVYTIDKMLAQRFGSHPGVIAWHISNEFSGECHCPLCQAEFRRWLRQKYGSVDRLNQAWATTFWSHTYQSFEQVESPSPIGEQALHGLNLDWKRFVTDRTRDFILHEVRAIRDGGADQPTTVNLMCEFKGLNYFKFADAVDFISWDSYPAWHKREESLEAMDFGMQHDLMRSIGNQPFLLMESCPSATNWHPVSKLKKPGMHLASSLHAIAHGSDSVLYFQIRQSRGASEKFHGAVIDHYGEEDTRVFADVSDVGRALVELQEVAGSRTPSEVAVICDTENRWAVEDAQGPRNEGIGYLDTVKKVYAGFRKQGLNVDVIDMESALNRYRIVAAPMLYLFRAGFAEKARAFVENGGRLILTYWSGIVDETDLCYLGGCPHDLMDVMGLRSTEIDGLYDWESNACIPVEGNSLGMDGRYTCKNLCDLVRTTTAETLMTYESDFYQGMPALTRNRFGAGEGYYVCADFEAAFYDVFLRKVVDEAGIRRIFPQIPDGVEVCSRETAENRYIFVQNFNREAVPMALPPEDSKVLYGHYDGTIERFGTVVWKQSIDAPV